MARKKLAVRQQSNPHKASEGLGIFPVVTSKLLNMFCVTAAFATVLAVLLCAGKSTCSVKAGAAADASKRKVFSLVQNATRRGIRHCLTHGWQRERGRQCQYLH